jgi:hypothetical protein
VNYKEFPKSCQPCTQILLHDLHESCHQHHERVSGYIIRKEPSAERGRSGREERPPASGSAVESRWQVWVKQSPVTSKYVIVLNANRSILYSGQGHILPSRSTVERCASIRANLLSWLPLCTASNILMQREDDENSQ